MMRAAVKINQECIALEILNSPVPTMDPVEARTTTIQQAIEAKTNSGSTT
jgi:hypothetical protein